MDPKLIGDFIRELRKEKKITQEKLAEDLIVDRTTVVKWEGGKAIPTNDSLVLIAEYFNISLDELLNGKRYPKEDEEVKTNSKNKVILSLLTSNRKSKKITLYFIILTIIISISFLIYYFFTTYNSIHVYKLYGEGKEYIIRDSLLVVTNDKVYFKIGNITDKNSNKILDINKISLYTSDNKVLFTGDPNELLREKRNNIELFKSIFLKKQYDNLYLNIYNDEIDSIKLKAEQDFNNKGLLFFKEQTNNNNLISNNQIELKPNKEFTYNKENNSYYLKKENFEITYFVVDQNVKVFEYHNNYEIRYYYFIKYDVLNYKKIHSDEIEEKSFNTNNPEFDYFKNIYLDKYFEQK